jgi:hypothetical protein
VTDGVNFTEKGFLRACEDKKFVRKTIEGETRERERERETERMKQAHACFRTLSSHLKAKERVGKKNERGLR